MLLKRNLKLAILILILVLLIGGFIVYFNFFNYDTVKVGTTEFILPEGYHDDGFNEFGAVSITNGKNHIFLIEFNDTDEYKHANEYLKSKADTNETLYLSKFDMGNRTLYKSSNSEKPSNVHYWFEKGNKSYEIYKWDGNPNMDNIVLDFFNS